MSSSLLHLNDATRRPDPGPSPRTSRAEAVTRATVDHLVRTGQACKGAEEHLVRHALATGIDRGGGAARCVGALLEHLATPAGEVYRHPEWKPKKSASLLRRTLAAMPIPADLAERLADDLALDANRLAPARYQAEGLDAEAALALAARHTAEFLVEKLDARGDWHAWSAELAPEPDWREAAVLDALRSWQSHLAMGVTPTALAVDPDWLALGTMPPHLIHQTIKARLEGPFAHLARSQSALAQIDMSNDLFLPPADPTRSPWGPRPRSDRRPPAPTPFAGPDAVNLVRDEDRHNRYTPA